MKWVTRRRVKVDRVACPWLIRKFIDPGAEFLFVPPEEVLSVARQEGAVSFDAPGARYTHRGGLCTFEVLVEEHGLREPGLVELARIVHGADIAGEESATPQSAGLKAIAEGFSLLHDDDHQILARAFPLYDALYAWCQARAEAEGREI